MTLAMRTTMTRATVTVTRGRPTTTMTRATPVRARGDDATTTRSRRDALADATHRGVVVADDDARVARVSATAESRRRPRRVIV